MVDVVEVGDEEPLRHWIEGHVADVRAQASHLRAHRRRRARRVNDEEVYVGQRVRGNRVPGAVQLINPVGAVPVDD